MLWLACADEGKDEILDEKNEPLHASVGIPSSWCRGSIKSLIAEAGLCLKKTVWITAVANTATTWV